MKHFSAFLLMLVLLTGCAAQPADSPAPVSTPAATAIADIPTAAPALAATATPLPEEPGLAEKQGVLTPAQRERLWQESLKYLAGTEEEGIQIASAMNFVSSNGHPSNMCGPLAIAVLRDAGLVNRYTSLHDFWLLRPDKDANILTQTFPPEQFETYRFATRTDQFDFKQFPLQEGDFLYLYAGLSGSFEHMLTVTRVDEAGRAYTVTNIATDDGYVIREVMLYDPNQPGVGQFYDWTNREINRYLGMTGFGGFDIWRFKTPVSDPTGQQTRLADEIDAAIAEHGGDWHIVIEQAGGQVVYSRYAQARIHSASVIKVPVAMLFFEALEQQHNLNGDYETFLSTRGPGRTYNQLLEAMLVKSEEEATQAIIDTLRLWGLNIPATLQKWNAPNTNIDSRTSTAGELATLYRLLYEGNATTPEARELILNWMAAYTPNDSTRLGVLSELLPEGWRIHNKRGTITTGRLIVGDAAIVSHEANGTTYVIVAMGYPGEIPTDDLKMVANIEAIAHAFARYIRAETAP